VLDADDQRIIKEMDAAGATQTRISTVIMKTSNASPTFEEIAMWIEQPPLLHEPRSYCDGEGFEAVDPFDDEMYQSQELQWFCEHSYQDSANDI